MELREQKVKNVMPLASVGVELTGALMDGMNMDDGRTLRCGVVLMLYSLGGYYTSGTLIEGTVEGTSEAIPYHVWPVVTYARIRFYSWKMHIAIVLESIEYSQFTRIGYEISIGCDCLQITPPYTLDYHCL